MFGYGKLASQSWMTSWAHVFQAITETGDRKITWGVIATELKETIVKARASWNAHYLSSRAKQIRKKLFYIFCVQNYSSSLPGDYAD